MLLSYFKPPPKTEAKSKTSSTIKCQLPQPGFQKEVFNNLIDTSKVDIVVGMESWLMPDIHVNEVFPPGIIVYRQDLDGHGGGVLIMVKNDMISSHMEELESECGILWVKIEIASGKPL